MHYHPTRVIHMHETNSGNSIVSGLVVSVISIWAFWFTVVNPTLWGMATSLQSPFDLLAMPLVVIAAFVGAVEIALIAVIVLFVVGWSCLAVIERVNT